jgi:hypothetical protein
MLSRPVISQRYAADEIRPGAVHDDANYISDHLEKSNQSIKVARAVPAGTAVKFERGNQTRKDGCTYCCRVVRLGPKSNMVRAHNRIPHDFRTELMDKVKSIAQNTLTLKRKNITS